MKSDRFCTIVIVIRNDRHGGQYILNFSPVLDETDGSRLFTEALSAQVKAVLADETGLVGAETAGGNIYERTALRCAQA
jgi:hypothetical protein